MEKNCFNCICYPVCKIVDYYIINVKVNMIQNDSSKSLGGELAKTIASFCKFFKPLKEK